MSSTEPTQRSTTVQSDDPLLITAPMNIPVPLSKLLAGHTPPASPPFAGGALTEPLILAGDATANLGAVTLQQLNAAIAALQSEIDALKAPPA